MKEIENLFETLIGVTVVAIAIVGVIVITNPSTKCKDGYLYLNRTVPVQLFDSEKNPIYCVEK